MKTRYFKYTKSV